jgi:hypothetical protein
VAIGHADDGLVEIVVTKPDSAEHGAIGGPGNASGDDFAAAIE